MWKMTDREKVKERVRNAFANAAWHHALDPCEYVAGMLADELTFAKDTNVLSKAEEQAPASWVLTAHEKQSNYRWTVTASCPVCSHDKGEIYAGFFTGFPKEIAESTVLDCAASVKLDNFCPNCGADMRERRPTL